MNRYFSEVGRQMVSRHMKKCSSSLTIREFQNKTIVRYYLRPLRNNGPPCIGRYKINSNALLWNYYLVQTTKLWKIVWRIFKELRTQLSYDLVIPFHIKPQDSKTFTQEIYTDIYLLQHLVQQPGHKCNPDAQ